MKRDGTKVEYAPLYTRGERLRYLLGLVLLTLGLALLARYGLLPRFREAVTAAPCWSWNGVGGVELLFYGVFSGLPLLFALIALPLVLRGWRSIRQRRFPPEGEKTFRPTRVRRGHAARAIGVLQVLPVVMLVGMALWGAGQARELLQKLEGRSLPADCAGAGISSQTVHPE